MSLVDQRRILWHPELFAYNAKVHGSRTAVSCEGDRLTWSEFHARTNRIANALIALGLRKGDKVCLLMANSIAMFALMWATIRAGGVIAPLNVLTGRDALPAMIGNSDARFLFADAANAPVAETIRDRLAKVTVWGLCDSRAAIAGWTPLESLVAGSSDAEPAVAIDMSDSMNIIYSSGSTGIPKGIEHTHAARLAYTMAFAAGLQINRFTINICSTPLYTNGTWLAMLPTVYVGGTVVLMPKFSGSDFLQTVQRERATHTFLVPTQASMILEAPDLGSCDASSMQVLMLGSQMLTRTVADRLRAAFPAAGLYEVYGMTECSLTLAIPGDFARGKVGTVGLPLFGADVRIIDGEGKEAACGEVGEIAGSTSVTMKGYYKDPKRTQDLIWREPVTGRAFLKTGDLGRMDADGYLYIAGRARDMIKSGGINVFASDLEEVFSQHPDVIEAAAIAIPHPKWGETPLLLAIVRPGAVVTEHELMQWGNERLGKFQRVSRVEFRSEFPRTGNNKIIKRALRDPYWANVPIETDRNSERRSAAATA